MRAIEAACGSPPLTALSKVEGQNGALGESRPTRVFFRKLKIALTQCHSSVPSLLEK